MEILRADHSGPVASFLAQPQLLKWTESLTRSAASLYDRALDSEYLRTHIGGGNHRLFDGGHTLAGAWARVREASSESLSNQVAGYAKALWKDVTTQKGLPFVTLEKVTYDRVAEILTKIPGVTRDWVYDLLSYDMLEVSVACLSGVGAVFALRRGDMVRFSELVGVMGVTSLVSANLLLGAVASVAVGYVLWSKRGLKGKAILKGSTLSGVSFAIFSVLSLPILVELVVALVASKAIGSHKIWGLAEDSWSLGRIEGHEKATAVPFRSSPTGRMQCYLIYSGE